MGLVNKREEALSHQWLHIHLLNGELYVFADDGHWEHTVWGSSATDWNKARMVTFKQLAGECCLGGADETGELLIRIPLKPLIRYGKFGLPYLEAE